jgi:DNA repair protein SbcD/Mre11
MRFLHTADWHAGKQLRGRSRIVEQREVLKEILDIAVQEKIDYVLVTGDLFDSPAPPADAEQAVFGFFAALMEKQIGAVVVGGNHDHPKRLEALRLLLDPLRIYIRPELEAPAAGGIVRLDKNGETAIIAAMPWVPDNRLTDAAKLMELSEDQWYAQYSESVGRICGAFGNHFQPDAINILAAHLFVQGADTTASERAIHTSAPFAVSGAYFPASAHYIALGHLHRPQQIAAPSPTYYSGSTLQLDFGEASQEKRVVIVDSHPGKPSRMESIPLQKGRKLQDVRGSVESLQARAAEFGDDYLRVTVETATLEAGISARVREFLVNAIDIRVEARELASAAPVASLETLGPAELFAEYFRSSQKSEPPEEMLALFRELHEGISNETRATRT